ncbi:hypothetical protein [Microtetraspora malaysiensis]|uniref:hypothetical protein n=1 Tax=Microtetraspora malaysiensis TaxID=161358 RepID=UPI003D8ED431
MAEAGEPYTTPMPQVRPEPPPGPRRVRLIYTALACVGTAVAIVLVFTAFSGDRPGAASAPLHQGRSAAPSVSASVSASAVPRPVRLPPVPTALTMVVHPGSGTPAGNFVVDQKSGIGYAGFAAPWRTAADPSPFVRAQRAGRALIVSCPMPGAVPEALTAPEAYRTVAARAARWTLRFQPEGGSLAWTASQPLRRGTGWLLGYRVTYRIDGRTHASEAIVAVVGTGRNKPALLFATVPDTTQELYRDLNMLFWTLRPI